MGTVVEVEMVCGRRWGTWEELLLGGAVLRHGTRDWDLVAAELRARATSSPSYIFTPELNKYDQFNKADSFFQACKAKYEDLQRHYSGCATLLEELRKQRMAELRRALELSEDSIGSLESKLESLRAQSQDVNDSSQTESLMHFQKVDGVDSCSKELSKDGLSAGSFTEETRTNWSPQFLVLDAVSAEEIYTKPEVSASPEQEKVLSMGNLAETLWMGQGGILRRRRGKRKRKVCSKDIKEGSVGESEFLGSTDDLSATRCKVNTPTPSSSGQTGRLFGIDDQCKDSSKDEAADLTSIFDSIAENKSACVFRRPLDSQKRGRYKKMILRHTDLETIKSRIARCSITSAKELFRDLLLVANNALVYYSKNTREYKSAAILRDIVTKSLRQHLKDYISKSTISLLSNSPPILNTPVKPRSARPGKNKSPGQAAKPGNLVAKTLNEGKRPGNTGPPPSEESLAMIKKASGGRQRKAGRGSSASQQPENRTTKGSGRKKARVR